MCAPVIKKGGLVDAEPSGTGNRLVARPGPGLMTTANATWLRHRTPSFPTFADRPALSD
jgi:hypothetical protein